MRKRGCSAATVSSWASAAAASPRNMQQLLVRLHASKVD